jgi:hypothetical protein
MTIRPKQKPQPVPPESVDRSYRRFYSHAEMVEGTLRILEEPWTDTLDFSSLTQFKDIFISDGLAKREADAVWHAQCNDRPVLLYFVFEFQSKSLWHMAVRAMTTRGLLYQRLIEKGALPAGKLPFILVIVVYTGKGLWKAPLDMSDLVEDPPGGLEELRLRGSYLLLDLHRLSAATVAAGDHPAAVLFELEKSKTPADIRKGVERLVGMLSEEHPLRKIFKTWLQLVLMPRWFPGVDIPEVDNLEEYQEMMEQEMPDWTRETLAKGERKGKREAGTTMLERQIQRKFGSLPGAIRTRIEAANPDQLFDWAEQLIMAETLDEVFSPAG